MSNLKVEAGLLLGGGRVPVRREDVNEALKRELIWVGQQCIRIATDGRGMSRISVYKTASAEYKEAAKARDETLAKIRLADPSIRAPSSKSRTSEWVHHALPYKEVALREEVVQFNLREDIDSIGYEFSKASLEKRKQQLEKERELTMQ